MNRSSRTRLSPNEGFSPSELRMEYQEWIPRERNRSIRFLFLFVGVICFALGWIAAQFVQ